MKREAQKNLIIKAEVIFSTSNSDYATKSKKYLKSQLTVKSCATSVQKCFIWMTFQIYKNGILLRKSQNLYDGEKKISTSNSNLTEE